MARKKSSRRAETPLAENDIAELRRETSGAPSATAVAAEALRTGVVPLTPTSRPRDIHAHDDDYIPRDADGQGLGEGMSGEETAMGHMPTPDNNDVDAMGRAMGIQEEDSGGLRTSSELLDARDRHRMQQDGPDRKPE